MWKIDTAQTGIPSIFREYEWLTIEFIYKLRKGITTKNAWEHVNQIKKISRTSIHFFLRRLVDAGIIDNGEESGKGGFHGSHKVLVEREDLPRAITLDILKTLKSVFPEDPFLMDVHRTAQNIIPISDKPR